MNGWTDGLRLFGVFCLFISIAGCDGTTPGTTSDQSVVSDQSAAGEGNHDAGGDAREHPPFTAQVPLRLTEVADVARKHDPVSSGVPLPRGILFEPVGIQVVDPQGAPVPAQFRVIERWTAHGEDRSIKWLLVTFLASVPAKSHATYILRAGTNPKPATPIKAIDTATAYKLGSFSFAKDFSAPLSLVLTAADGTTKHKASDQTTIKWKVEEHGPVRACLRAESSADTEAFGFIAWICGFAGLDRVDLTLVLKNTPRKARGPLYFTDFSVKWASQGSSYALGTEGDKASEGSVVAGKPVYLYQDSSGTDRWDRLGEIKDDWGSYTLSYSKLKDLGKPKFRGYRVLSTGGTPLAAGDHALGWARLGQSGVLVRYFWQQFPKAVEVRPGELIVRLWPKYWQGHGGVHWLDDLQRKAHDLSLRQGKLGPADAQAFNNPLVIHPGLAWLRKSGVRGFLAAKYKREDPKPERAGKWEYGWVTFGGSYTDRIRRRYHDVPMDEFVRTGDPYAAYRTWVAMRHSSAMTPLWADGYSYPADRELLKPCYCCPARTKGTYTAQSDHHGYMPWNARHWMAAELFDGWRLFGDFLARDAIEKQTVFLRFYTDLREKGKNGSESRVDALPLTNLCEALSVTEDQATRSSIKKHLDVVWSVVNKRRGYYLPLKVPINELGKQEHLADKPFMLSNLTSGLIDVYRMLGDERARDAAIGITDYSLIEGYINGCKGFLYSTPIDPAVRDQARAASLASNPTYPGCPKKEWISAWQMHKPLAWAYLQTGEARYKKPFDEMTARMKVVNQPLAGLHWNEQCDQVTEEPRADGTPPAAIADLGVTRSGAQVKLAWTAPADAVRHRVKHAALPLVDRVTAAQQKSHTNWWAAAALSPPGPPAGKTKISMTVSDLPAGKRCFAVRSFDAASNRSALSNVACVE